MKFSPEKLEILIARNQLTIAELGRKADVPTITVSQALRGTRNPTLRTIGKIAHGLGVDVTELIEQEGVA